MLIFLWVIFRWRITNKLNLLVVFLGPLKSQDSLVFPYCLSQHVLSFLSNIHTCTHPSGFSHFVALWVFLWQVFFIPVVCNKNVITVFLLGAWNKLSLTKSRPWDFLKTFQNVYFYQCVTCLLWFHSREYNILIRNCKKKKK